MIRSWNAKYKVLQTVYQDLKKHLHIRSWNSHFPAPLICKLTAVFPPNVCIKVCISSPFRIKTQGWNLSLEHWYSMVPRYCKKACKKAFQHCHLKTIRCFPKNCKGFYTNDVKMYSLHSPQLQPWSINQTEHGKTFYLRITKLKYHWHLIFKSILTILRKLF